MINTEQKQKIIEALEKAQKNVARVIKKTPLIYSYFFSDEYQAKVYLKPENLQRTGSFKVRGAYNKISSLSDDERSRGLIASSAGNHAQGVALAAKECGVKATIVMPATTPFIKVEATRSYGAKVVLYGELYDDAYQKALELQKEHGYTFVHAFNDQDVIFGQGTVGMEIMEELDNIDIILVPVGGGGLISGLAAAVKAIKPSIRVIGVEPIGAQTLTISLDHDVVTPLERVQTIAEGVAVRQTGQKAYDFVREFVDEIVLVDDTDLMEAFFLLTEKEKLVVESSGALSVAALKKIEAKGKTIVSVLSGGNMDMLTISEMINRGLVVRGRIFCFAVELSDTPGQLQQISALLAQIGANIVKLEHDQFKTVDRFKHVRLEVTCETNGKEHVNQIKQVLNEHGYKLEIVY